MSRGLPDLSVTLNVTMGLLPGVALSTFMMLRTTPGNVAELFGTTCAPGMDESNSSAAVEIWQSLHCPSSGCGRLTWPCPVAKLTSSWQEPQAAWLGLVFQLSACFGPCAWQVVQLRTSCGNTTVEKSVTAPRCTTKYFPPACTLGRLDPICSLWIKTLKSTVFSVSGFTLCGVWQRTQKATLVRGPGAPCALSGS